MSLRWAGPIDLPALGDLSDLPQRQNEWRSGFVQHLYGPMPEPPTSVAISRELFPDDQCERIEIKVKNRGGAFDVDAALWLPQQLPAPLIIGLDFIGPIGILSSDSFPLDPRARILARPEYGVTDGRLHDVLRGTSTSGWPVEMMLNQGFGVLTSCYGSWAPDDPKEFRKFGVGTLSGAGNAGAISCWAWAISRLIDASNQLPEIDTANIAIAGHSRLGKAALWASAWDNRITTVFANDSGCAGTSPAAHSVGETLEQLSNSFPHWLKPSPTTKNLPIDQHQLIALSAPRNVYVANAEADDWADPLGSYESLRVASAAWGDTPDNWASPRKVDSVNCPIIRGPLGHHIRQGGHDLLPVDWRHFLKFLTHSSFQESKPAGLEANEF